jgi:CDP-diacylglycerol--serine O-phosphatidyltransferase
MLAFGVAPALICFSWALSGLGKLGWAAAFIYVACAALRLARFNVQQGTADKRFFTGLASPSAAGLVVFMVWSFDTYGIEITALVSILAAALTVLAGMLMVINLKYYSFKDLDFRNRVPFFAILAMILVIVVVALNPPVVLFTMAIIYAASGPAMAIYIRRRKKQEVQADIHL